MAEDFECLVSFQVLDFIPVKKFRSKKTGITFCFAQVQGPLVNGFLCLATEAHDDDGLPHTLEHLVFMGSEKYPYKGVLDLLANRCLAQGTNAWTDTDHTCYTMETAGSEGFLNLLPIYLDHILYPTLTESAYITEVHHVNGEGEDAGVVYCEMQGRENTGNSRTYLTFLREMFPGRCGCKSETGGIMKNLRTSCSHVKVCNYHQEFYRPENLCVIITGQVEPDKVFEAVKPFENKVLSKDPLPPYVRPWQDHIPSLLEPVNTRIQFPTEDESSGIVIVGCRGPKAQNYYEMTAIEVICEYLTDTSVAPLQRDLVEIPEPFCSGVGYSHIEFSESVIYIKASNVATAKLESCKEKIVEVLANISKGKEEIDMKRMASVVHRQILTAKEAYENKPHETLAFMAIGDVLYSQKPGDFQQGARKIERLKELQREPQAFWANFIKNYFLSKSTVSVIAEPSAMLMAQMAETEKKRIEEQRKDFGEDGLKKLAEKLEKAKKDNEVEPPSMLISCLPVPSTTSISFHPVKIFSNCRAQCSPLTEPEAVMFPIKEIPFAFQLNHVLSMFIEMTITLNTAVVPDELRPFLSLYLEVIFESPILRDGALIPHEKVVAELASDTIDHQGSLGLSGNRFQPQGFSQLAVIGLQLEVEKYEKGVQWLHELLYKVQFTSSRLEIVGKKMMNDIARMKREGRRVSKTLLQDIVHTKESNFYSANMIRQYRFLERLLRGLKSDPDKIIEKFNQLRDLLTHPSNIQVFLSANVKNLPRDAHLPWMTSFLRDKSTTVVKEVKPVLRGISLQSKDGVHGKIVGVGAVESSFLIQACPCFDDYNHPDLAPLMVFLECLTTLEGPIWRQVRGLGLSYGYGIRADPEQGLLYFALIKSTHVVKAYEKCKEIVDDYTSSNSSIDSVMMESAISSVIFEIVDRERSVGSTASESVSSQFKNVGPNYNREILDKLDKVTVEDLTRVGKKYVAPLFDPAVSQCAVCCHPSKVEEIKEGFHSMNKKLVLVQSLDEEFTWSPDLLAKL